MDLSIVIPCLNEADTLEICINKSLKKIEELNIQGEIIIADNGSNDGSVEIAKKYNVVLVNVSKKGYGHAIHSGTLVAKGKYVLVADADNSYDLNEIPKFYSKIINNFDLVQGCRLPSGGGKINPGAMPISHRLIGNPFFTKLAKIFYNVPFNDIYCGMKIFKKSFYNNLNFFSGGMVYNIEVLLKFYIASAKIDEVPITLYKDGRKKSRSHLKTIPDGLKTLKFLLICSPKYLYFFPGALIFLFSLIKILFHIVNPDLIETQKKIINSFIFLSFSIQIIMLGLFSTIISEKIGFTKKGSLEKFFNIFNIKFSLILNLGTIFSLIFLKFSNIYLFPNIHNDLIINFGIFISSLILINTFFVSLLTIDK